MTFDQPDDYPRSLTPRERDVLNAMAAVIPGRAETQSLVVTSMCSCGCPTIHFNDRAGPSHLVAEASAPGEQERQVLLFADDNGLSSLELVFGDADDQLPDPSTLYDLRSR